MLTIRRILFVTVFLVVWGTSIWVYVYSKKGSSPSEGVMGVITLAWLAVFIPLGRKIFRRKMADPTAVGLGLLQSIDSDVGSHDTDLGN
jgi:hypothetical protein